MDQGHMCHKQSNTLNTHISHPQTLAIHLWNGKWLCYEGVFLRIWSLYDIGGYWSPFSLPRLCAGTFKIGTYTWVLGFTAGIPSHLRIHCFNIMLLSFATVQGLLVEFLGIVSTSDGELNSQTE